MTSVPVLEIKAATAADVEIIVQILSSSRREYLPYAKSPHSLDDDRRWVRKTLLPAGCVVLAQLDGDKVGVLATSVSDGFGWIDQLYLAPGYVGRGIGAQLLAYALSNLPRPVRLWTFQQNKRAMKFYERHGFALLKFTDGADNEEKCPDVLYELS